MTPVAQSAVRQLESLVVSLDRALAEYDAASWPRRLRRSVSLQRGGRLDAALRAYGHAFEAIAAEHATEPAKAVIVTQSGAPPRCVGHGPRTLTT